MDFDRGTLECNLALTETAVGKGLDAINTLWLKISRGAQQGDFSQCGRTFQTRNKSPLSDSNRSALQERIHAHGVFLTLVTPSAEGGCLVLSVCIDIFQMTPFISRAGVVVPVDGDDHGCLLLVNSTERLQSLAF